MVKIIQIAGLCLAAIIGASLAWIYVFHFVGKHIDLYNPTTWGMLQLVGMSSLFAFLAYHALSRLKLFKSSNRKNCGYDRTDDKEYTRYPVGINQSHKSEYKHQDSACCQEYTQKHPARLRPKIIHNVNLLYLVKRIISNLGKCKQLRFSRTSVSTMW